MCAAAGGGGKKPALINSILQWLTKYVGGSIPFDDKVDPRLDSPELAGVNCLEFAGGTEQLIEDVHGVSYPVVLSGAFRTTASGTLHVFDSISDKDASATYYCCGINAVATPFISRRPQASPITKTSVTGRTFDDDVWHTYRYELNSDTDAKLHIDGLLEVHDTVSVPLLTTINTRTVSGYLRSSGVTSPFVGKTTNHSVSYGHGTTDLVIMFGQSNMTGVPAGWGDLPASLQSPQTHDFWYDLYNPPLPETPTVPDPLASADNVKLQPVSDQLWGVEIPAIDAIYQSNGRHMSVVKCSMGGAQLGGPSWWESGSVMRDNLLALITTALADISTNGKVIGRVLTVAMIGEGDSTEASWSSAYLDNMDDLTSAIEATVGYPIDHMVIPRVGVLAEEPKYQYRDVVKLAQTTIGDRIQNDSFSTENAQLNPDELHYDAYGLTSIGSNLASAFISFNDSDLQSSYGCGEGVELPLDSSGQAHHSREFTGSWSTSNGVSSNIVGGFTPANRTDGASYYQTPYPVQPDMEYEIYLNSFDGTSNTRTGGRADTGTYERFYINFTSSSSFIAYIGDLTAPLTVTNVDFPVKIVINTNGLVYVNDVLRGDTTTPVVETGTYGVSIMAEQQGASNINPMAGELIWCKLRVSGVEIADYRPINDVSIVNKVDGAVINSGSGVVTHKKIPSGSSSLSTTNLGGYVHNGSECSIIQTAAVDAFGGASFWGDGLSWTAKSYADMRAHPNGFTNTWFKCVDINGVPHYEEEVQYDVDLLFTTGDVGKNKNYFGDNCGTGIISALYDSEGELVLDSNSEVIFTTEA